jgi:hypothetical protein
VADGGLFHIAAFTGDELRVVDLSESGEGSSSASWRRV